MLTHRVIDCLLLALGRHPDALVREGALLGDLNVHAAVGLVRVGVRVRVRVRVGVGVRVRVRVRVRIGFRVGVRVRVRLVHAAVGLEGARVPLHPFHLNVRGRLRGRLAARLRRLGMRRDGPLHPLAVPPVHLGVARLELAVGFKPAGIHLRRSASRLVGIEVGVVVGVGLGMGFGPRLCKPAPSTLLRRDALLLGCWSGNISPSSRGHCPRRGQSV